MQAGPVRTTTSISRARVNNIKTLFEAKSLKRQLDTGEGVGMQMVPYEIKAKTGHSAGNFSTLSKRSGSKYYYDKWAYNTRTNPVYPLPQAKEFDVNIGTLSVPIAVLNTGQFNSLSRIVRGADDDDRIGGLVANKAVYYQFVLNIGTIVPAVPNAVRHMVVYDRQANQDNPTLATFLSDPSNPLTSPLNMNYRDRYIILADDRTTLSPNGDAIRIIKNYYRINLASSYGDATNEPVSGNVFVFLCSDRPNDVSAPTIYGTWRLKYFDN